MVIAPVVYSPYFSLIIDGTLMIENSMLMIETRITLKSEYCCLDTGQQLKNVIPYFSVDMEFPICCVRQFSQFLIQGFINKSDEDKSATLFPESFS
jgi:hypothetical protein